MVEELSRDELAERYYEDSPAYYTGKYFGVKRMSWDLAVVEGMPAVAEAYAKVDLTEEMFGHGSEGFTVKECIVDQSLPRHYSSVKTVRKEPNHGYKHLTHRKITNLENKDNTLIFDKPPLGVWWFARFGIMVTVLMLNLFFFTSGVVWITQYLDGVYGNKFGWVFIALCLFNAILLFPAVVKEYKRWLDS